MNGGSVRRCCGVMRSAITCLKNSDIFTRLKFVVIDIIVNPIRPSASKSPKTPIPSVPNPETLHYHSLPANCPQYTFGYNQYISDVFSTSTIVGWKENSPSNLTCLLKTHTLSNRLRNPAPSMYQISQPQSNWLTRNFLIDRQVQVPIRILRHIRIPRLKRLAEHKNHQIHHIIHVHEPEY